MPPGASQQLNDDEVQNSTETCGGIVDVDCRGGDNQADAKPPADPGAPLTGLGATEGQTACRHPPTLVPPWLPSAAASPPPPPEGRELRRKVMRRSTVACWGVASASLPINPPPGNATGWMAEAAERALMSSNSMITRTKSTLLQRASLRRGPSILGSDGAANGNDDWNELLTAGQGSHSASQVQTNAVANLIAGSYAARLAAAAVSGSGEGAVPAGGASRGTPHVSRRSSRSSVTSTAFDSGLLLMCQVGSGAHRPGG